MGCWSLSASDVYFSDIYSIIGQFVVENDLVAILIVGFIVCLVNIMKLSDYFVIIYLNFILQVVNLCLIK